MITVKTLPAPPVDRREIFRYARAGTPTPELEALLDACLKEAAPVLSYRVCFGEFPIKIDGARIDFGFAAAESAALAKFLAGAHAAILLAATVGAPLDRLIARAQVTSPTKALLFDAIGVERVEALCDAFSDSPRFSPGYGDLPLEFQREIFRALDCPRKIGLSLGESLLMTPSKFVTAILPIKE